MGRTTSCTRRALRLLAAVLAVTVVVAITLAAGGAPRAVAADPIVRPGDPVPGQYIVVLDASAEDSARVGRAVTEVAGGRVVDAYDTALPAVVVRANEATARELDADPRVIAVYQDGYVTVGGTQTPAPWDLDRLDQAAVPLDSSFTVDDDGTGVHAYIVDTGVRPTHADLVGRVTTGLDVVGDGRPGYDCNDHGTFVAGLLGGTLFGVAKHVSIVSVRTMNCAGTGTFSGIIAGVDWITAHAQKPAVANMSLGGPTYAPLDAAVATSIGSGVVDVVAACNENVGACAVSPARLPAAITVGATDSTDQRSSFSNFGSCLDLFAPGTSVVSLLGSSDNGLGIGSGTSFASPLVAGIAALVLQRHPTFTASQITDAITDASVRGVVGSPGTGSPNRLAQLVRGVSAHPGVVITAAGDELTADLMDQILGTDPNASNYDPNNFNVHAG